MPPSISWGCGSPVVKDSPDTEIVYGWKEQSKGTTKTTYDLVKQCRKRKRIHAAELINDGASTSAAGAVEIMRMDDEIASILTPDCAGIDCVLSSFVKTH
ncbi:uncharacterized protein TNCV_317361 [Trichonephila clavipes]|nr:uncharacterized protein TNCV_317361 [Trichonephila clavipes]